MAVFISLLKYTAQGIRDIKGSPGRLDEAREKLAAIGVTLKDFYLTMGEYDAVVVIDAPDVATAARGLLATGAQGNVSTTTLAALTEDEFRSVVDGMP